MPDAQRLPARIRWHGRELEVDLSSATSLAIELDPHGPQPAFFTDQAASAWPLEGGGFVGSVAKGGSCNAEWMQLAPHCHGTHTECRGHISEQRLTVLDTICQEPGPARLVSLEGRTADTTDEHYPVPLEGHERLLTLAELQEQLGDGPGLDDCQALVIRTLPNPPGRQHRDYAREPFYPVLSTEAMVWLCRQPLRHLLLDTPSLDRADDGGRLANHHLWWHLEGDEETESVAARRSVTEMIYVPDSLADGYYWLELQLPPLAADALPSRPLVYPVLGCQDNTP